MAERWVANASPLIVLSKINQQQLLEQLADELALPEAVLVEINAGPEEDAARRYLAESPLPVVSVMPEPLVAAWDLGAGESAVLAHALAHPGWKAVVDDGAAGSIDSRYRHIRHHTPRASGETGSGCRSDSERAAGRGFPSAGRSNSHSPS
jgi:predicted nucleic acid-binding protein